MSFLDPFEDAVTLRSLSVSATALRQLAQWKLFLEIVLCYKSPYHCRVKGPPGSKLLSLLTMSPHVARYIKRVQVKTLNFKWTANDVHFLDAVLKLPLEQLERLRLAAAPHNPGNDWGVLTENAQKALALLCCGPSLTHLSLTSWPAMFLTICGPSVQHLDIENPRVHVPGWKDLVQKRDTPLVLRSLILRGDVLVDPSYNFIVGASGADARIIDLSSVERLTFYPYSEDEYEALGLLLERCSPSLRSLKVALHWDCLCECKEPRFSSPSMD